MKLTATTWVTADGVMHGLGGPEEDRSGGFGRGGCCRPGHATIPRHRPGHSARPGRLAVHPEGGNDPGLPAHRPPQYETATPTPST